jgi:hypothetical protein
VAFAAEASVYLVYEFWRLVLDPGLMGGVDLRSRVRETHAWFGGLPVYGHIIPAVYPPATYALLWPFVGWIQFGAARWLWALVSIAALIYLAALVLRETGARKPVERAVIVLALLALYPTGQTIGDGQFLVAVLPLLLIALLLLQRPGRDVRTDLLAALCLLLTLVKFTAVVPFLVVACFAPWRKRPLVLVLLAYAGLTVLAAAYQRPGLTTLLHHWLKVSSDQAASHGTVYYANVQAWLAGAGLKGWILPVSAAILIALGYWTWRHRNADPWLLIGVAGYAARFWVYHGSYDDILIVFPMIALFRFAARGPEIRDRKIAAGLLLATTLAVMIVPGGLFLFPTALQGVFTTFETVVWLTGLGFLLIEARANSPALASGLTVARTRVEAAVVSQAPVSD